MNATVYLPRGRRWPRTSRLVPREVRRRFLGEVALHLDGPQLATQPRSSVARSSAGPKVRPPVTSSRSPSGSTMIARWRMVCRSQPGWSKARAATSCRPAWAAPVRVGRSLALRRSCGSARCERAATSMPTVSSISRKSTSERTSHVTPTAWFLRAAVISSAAQPGKVIEPLPIERDVKELHSRDYGPETWTAYTVGVYKVELPYAFTGRSPDLLAA